MDDQMKIIQLYRCAQASFISGDLEKTKNILLTLFTSTDESRALSVHAEFFSYCRDLKSNKSLALFHAKLIEKWLDANQKCEKSAPVVEEDLKITIMPIITFCHSSTANILIKIFKLDEPPNEFLKPFISNLIAQERLKEAITVTLKLSMQNHFGLFEMVLPLLTQNKMNLVEEYLIGCKSQQIECVKMIDSWLEFDFDLIEFLQKNNIFQIRSELLRPKFVIKLLTRWLKIFLNINDIYCAEGREICPNLCKQKSLTNLRYLLYRHYVEMLSSVETTQELIMKSVADDKWLQEQLVDILGTSYGDWDSARQWANLYGVKHELLSYSSCTAHQNETLEASESDWDCEQVSNDGVQHNTNLVRNFEGADPSQWYDLKLPISNVHFVASIKSLKQSTEEILKNQIVGVDSEWVPDFAKNGSVSVSLLQIASFDAVYLIDVSYFCSSEQDNKDAFCDLVNRLFLSNDILKIGFGISEDLRKLAASIVGLDNALKNTVRVLDLCTAVRHLERVYPHVIDFSKKKTGDDNGAPSSKKESGLSKLVHRCLGKPLKKCEQMSDWERRPLRQSQLIYASLDAFVLLELWRFIQSQLKLCEIDHTLETIKNVQVKKKSNRTLNDTINKGTKHNLESCSENVSKEKLPSEFKVVCDNMLQGLGRQLRCCGVDVRILSNFEDHDMAAKIAMREDRAILTSGTPFHHLSSLVKNGYCFDVPCGIKAKDQAAIVLEYYNVKVTSKDIFSRCQLCNGNKYLKVSPHVMRQCIKKRQHVLSRKLGLYQNSDTGKSNKYPHASFQLPSDNMKNVFLVGRGRHIYEQSTKSTRCMHGIEAPKKTNDVGKIEKDVSEVVDLSADLKEKLEFKSSMTEIETVNTTEKKTGHPYSEFDDEDDDLLMVCSSSRESKLPDSPEFLPIESEKADSAIQNVTGVFQFKTVLDDEEESQNTNYSNDKNFLSQTCSGIIENEKERSDFPSLVTKKHKDGIVPFIINPDSVCTQGYINFENITIVSFDSSHGSGTSIDSTITPLQCEQVPHNMLDHVKVFYCCVKCGKVFWEGRHFSQVLQQFSHILSKD